MSSASDGVASAEHSREIEIPLAIAQTRYYGHVCGPSLKQNQSMLGSDQAIVCRMARRVAGKSANQNLRAG